MVRRTVTLAAMKPHIGPFSLEWLLTPVSSALPADQDSYGLQRLPYDIPAEIGQAWVERLALGEGFNLYRAVHCLEKAPFGQLIPIMNVSSREPEPMFNAQIWLSGMGCHQERWHGGEGGTVEILAGPGQDTFRFRKESDARILIMGGTVSEMRSVFISESVLQSLVGDETSALLREKLGLNGQTKSVVVPMPPHLSAPLKEAMSEQYAGPTRRLFAQAKTLEYLGGLVNFLHADNKTTPLRRHVAKVRELKDHLLSLEGRLPTLNELAKDFGLSSKRLNGEFSAEFGESIFAFVTAHRLEQAHSALLESAVPMKVISERLGYSHVNHFITAFRKKFGYSPGTLRKK